MIDSADGIELITWEGDEPKINNEARAALAKILESERGGYLDAGVILEWVMHILQSPLASKVVVGKDKMTVYLGAAEPSISS